MEQVTHSYSDQGDHVDAGLLARRQWHWAYREFTGLATALDANDAAEIDDAVRKLKHGAMSRLLTP